ncbi:MAG TPA: rhodanese-like domain-containing protein [Gammaproteobacteria bacterium]|nr:rhodanese-like domain-containing protein [Gammaproteobacteria bacterium]
MLHALPSKNVISLCTVLATSMSSAGAWAAATPEFIDGATSVNAEEFIALMESIPELVIIDSRVRGDRIFGFIEGSVSLPNTHTTCDSLSGIVNKSDAASLFYCNGIKCARSNKAIKIALDCGYSNIYWFRGGFEEWLKKGYPYLQE